MSYPSYSQQQGKIVSIHEIMNAQQNQHQPFYSTPQQATANNLFNTGPGYTTSVIFSGPNGNNVYNNPYHPQGGYPQGGYYQQGGY